MVEQHGNYIFLFISTSSAQPLSLSVILGGASTDPLVEFVLSNEFLNSLGDIQVNPTQVRTET